MGRGLRMIATVYCALATAFASAPAHAQGAIQKCVDDAGKVTYQDGLCPGGWAASRIERDTRPADPAALQRAAADRERAAAAAQARARVAAAEAANDARQGRSVASPKANSTTEPRYDYQGRFLSGRGVVGELPGNENMDGRSGVSPTQNARSAGTMPVPGIMQSPAPCKTAQCVKK